MYKRCTSFTVKLFKSCAPFVTVCVLHQLKPLAVHSIPVRQSNPVFACMYANRKRVNQIYKRNYRETYTTSLDFADVIDEFPESNAVSIADWP